MTQLYIYGVLTVVLLAAAITLLLTSRAREPAAVLVISYVSHRSPLLGAARC